MDADLELDKYKDLEEYYNDLVEEINEAKDDYNQLMGFSDEELPEREELLDDYEAYFEQVRDDMESIQRSLYFYVLGVLYTRKKNVEL